MVLAIRTKPPKTPYTPKMPKTRVYAPKPSISLKPPQTLVTHIYGLSSQKIPFGSLSPKNIKKQEKEKSVSNNTIHINIISIYLSILSGGNQ
jgi:hypothetical protein